MANLEILKPGTRTTIVGRSGSGKSTVAAELLKTSRQKWIVIDPKEDDKLQKLPNANRLRDLDISKVAKMWEKGTDYVLLTPSTTDAMEVDDFIMQMFEAFGNFGVYVDELYFIHKNGRNGKGLMTVLTRGRSEKVTYFGATQRPSWISTFCFSEVNHLIQMDLLLAKDRKVLFENTGFEVALENPPETYSFYLFDLNKKSVRIGKFD